MNKDDLEVAATAFLATVEGTFQLGLSKPASHRAITFALEHMMGIRK